eukprot:Em0001g3774a
MAFSAQYELDSYSETTISRKTNCRGFLVGGSIILAIAVTAVIIIALAVPLGVINEKYRSSSAGSMATSPTTTTNSYTTTMCLTPECVKLAASVLAAIDQTADPCTDFYKFSCGNWIRNTIIPTNSLLYDNFYTLTALNSQDLAYAVLNLRGGASVQALQKLSNIYVSCMNSNISDSQISLNRFLSKIGGWPLINISDGTEWSLNGEQFLQEKLLGSKAFFTLGVYVSPTDRTKNNVYVINSGLTLSSPPLYTSSTIQTILQNFISSTLHSLNPNNSLSYYQVAALRIVAIEQALAKITPTSKNYTVTTLGHLGLLWIDYHWIQQISTLFMRIGVHDIGSSEPIVLYGAEYFSQLSRVLSNFSNIDLLNYAKWQLFYTWMPYLHESMVNAYYKFQLLNNPLGQVPNTRNELCIDFIHSAMPYALGRVFAESLLPINTKDTATQMLTNIMQAFRTRIGSRTWLDQQTISVAQNKIDMMLANIAYPDLTFNDTWLNLIYQNLSASADSFQNNVDSYLTDGVPSALVLLRQPFNIWNTIFPTEVNAFYQPSMNNIYILEGIMRPPFFNPEWPSYFQYGSLGFVLGHEITHGFDNNGRLYDATGQLDNLWTQYSIHNFVSRQQCYINEYSNFTLFGIANNGTNTLPENIADNGGLISSYMAYQMTKQSNGAIQLLPGLNYTDDQMFFLAFGQTWCSYQTEEAVQYLVMTDKHSPAPLRVIGTVMNSAEFADAFKCPSSSPMNPPNKCSLW